MAKKAVTVEYLVVAPHPDDAELGMGGTILRLLAEGYSVGVVDLTTGLLLADVQMPRLYEGLTMRDGNLLGACLDGYAYQTVTPADLPDGATWVYNHPFFILLNVAVGGRWPGAPDETTVFPQTMLVDYVRVYGILP